MARAYVQYKVCMKGSLIYGVWNSVNYLRWMYWGVFRGQREEIRAVQDADL